MLTWLKNMIYPSCPLCDGQGGSMSGYYEPEWCDCELCNPNGEREEEVTRIWRWQWWSWRHRQRRIDCAIDAWCEAQADLEPTDKTVIS